MNIAAVLRKGRFRGGVHPPEQKGLAAGLPVEVIPNPDKVRLPLLQHLGAACEAAIASRSPVEMGQVLGRPGGFVSAPIHASLSGTAGRSSATPLPDGRHKLEDAGSGSYREYLEDILAQAEGEDGAH